MKLAEALGIVVARTGHRRFLELTDPENPSYVKEYEQVVIDMARKYQGAAPRGSVVIRSFLNSWTGYGQIAEWLGKGLENQGVPARYVSIGTDERYLGLPEFTTSRTVHSLDSESPVLQLLTPMSPLPENPTVAFTMWESSRISADAVGHLNRAQAVIVPCLYNAEGFRASGVTVPIHVVPLGIDRGEGYTPKPYAGGPITFGMAARMAHGGIRKGLNEGMRAFVAAFDRGEDARLHLKVWEDCLDALEIPDDPRIRVTTTPMTPPMMAEWYGSIDCLFVPSKGEGWGLHTHQAMACGRPVIAADYSGTREFWSPDFGWSLPYNEAPAGEFYAGQGNWAVPTPDGMVEALRASYRDPDGCRHKGALAANRASEFTWERTARGVHAVLADLGMVPLSPTPSPTPAPTLPGLFTRAANFASAAVSHVRAGRPQLGDAAYEARLAICATCDQLLPGGQCAGCGCNLRLKARWSEQACPLDKWPEIGA